MLFNEDTFEQAVIELFENMGYTHIYAPDMNRTDYSRPLLDDALAGLSGTAEPESPGDGN